MKIKGIQYIDAYILGYSLKKKALVLGDETHRVIGKVGTGFKDEELERIIRRLIPTEKKHDTQWVKPHLQCRVGFSEWTNDHQLRQPRFVELLKEPFPNLNKVFWPKEKITKGDLITYYREMAPVILPYLKDRPQVLHRFPDGIEGESFFQKRAGNLSKDIPSVFVTPHERYLMAQDVESLLYLVNLGCIELNPFNARKETLDFPDYLVIDLDPRNISFETVTLVATEFRKVCEQLGLDSFPKTSGKKGIHIYLPLPPIYPFEVVRGFAELICRLVHEKVPDMTSLLRNPERREKRVYLDFLQNRSHTPMASVYSIRPVPGALVSTPLEWREVNRRLDPAQFNLHTIQKRLDKKGDLFRGVLEKPNDLAKALENYELETQTDY